MKKRIAFTITGKRVLVALVLVAAAPFVVSLSGLVSIAASSGHFAPVGWFLHWTMQNAVSRQSLGISVPDGVDLADPALVQRAAGHFATGCAGCHGAPGVPQSPVVLSMMPAPPRLEGKVEEWADRELFWIVQHGIKYSGMPAWPTQDREDEVWAQVAFLRALPGMSPQTYSELALGAQRGEEPMEAGGETLASLDGIFQEALTDCARCHGRDGLGRGDGEATGAFPVIAGQPETYLAATLQAFSKGFRHSGFMQPPAKRYSDETLASLAKWYAQQPLPTPADGGSGETVAAAETPSDGIPPQVLPVGARGTNTLFAAAGAGDLPQQQDSVLELGRLIAVSGLPARKIPACESCHGQKGREKNEHYPYLSGQPAWYVETHLKLWKDHAVTRGGTRFSHLMTPIAVHMTEEQIAAVSAWYAAQPVGR